MKSLFFYLLQVIVVSGILYAYYHVALRNKKFHQYNRFYILAATLASILIPFLNIPVYFTNDDAQWMHALQNLSGQPVVFTLDEFPAEVEKPFNWNTVLYSLYAVIGLLGLARVLISIRKLKKIMREHPAEHLNGIRFINTAEPGTPFSFFRWLFWNNTIELDSEKGEQIFRHEVFHIQQKHSLDSIFMEAVTIIFWINPFFHLMKKELKAIHEFLADQFASKETQKWEYAEMLLMQALNTQHQLVHPFFHNQIKRRIAMITNPHKTSHQYLRKLLVLPLAALLVTLFAFSYKQKQAEEMLTIEELPRSFVDTTPVELMIEEVSAKSSPANVKQLAKGKKLVAPMVIFNGKEFSADEFAEFTGDKRNDVVIESKSLVTTSANDPQAIAKYGVKAKGGVLDFRDATIDTTPQKAPVRVSLRGVQVGQEPLIVLDGKIMEREPLESVLGDIKPDNIKSVTVLKDLSATSKYGDKGVHGVLEIVLKDKFATVSDEVKEVTITGHGVMKSDNVLIGKQAPKLEEVTVVGYGTRKADREVKEVTIVGRKREELDSARTFKVNGKVDNIRVSNVFSKVEVEPAFPGGALAWYGFLSKNLDAGTPAKNNAPAGQYTVFIQMKVSSEGRISDFKPITDHGFGMEEAAIAALEKSPYWNPAYQNGKAVAAYKIQPFIFLVNDGKNPKLNQVTLTPPGNGGMVYPNPATNKISLKLVTQEADDVSIRILDMEGKERSRTKATVIKGYNYITVSTADLSPGSYIVRADGVQSDLHSSFKLVKK